MPASGSGSLYPLKLESRSSNLRSATFSGEIVGSLGGYAVYPYNKGHKISGDTLTYHLPSEYNVSVDKDYVADSQAASVDAARESANFALFAKIVQDAESSSSVTGSSSATFKHLAGLLCIKIDKMPASTCTLTVTADKKISGDFRVNLTESEPRIRTDESSSDNSVSIISSGGTQNEPCVYYIPMPADDYSLTVRLGYKSPKDGEFASCTAVKTVEIERAKVKRVKVTYDTMYKGGYKVIAGHKFIDLGLPSGILWAETNVGAELPADFGSFYAWGETSVKEPSPDDGYMYYKPENYKYYKGFEDPIYTFNKYNSGGSMLTLDTSDDAAYSNWTTKCWTPTRDQVKELIDTTNTAMTLDATRKNSNGTTISGAEFKSKTNGNSIFLPYNGSYESEYHTGYSGARVQNYYGRYWTNNLIPKKKEDWIVYSTYTYQKASTLSFGWSSTGNLCVSEDWRFYGLGVRPVANPN